MDLIETVVAQATTTDSHETTAEKLRRVLLLETPIITIEIPVGIEREEATMVSTITQEQNGIEGVYVFGIYLIQFLNSKCSHSTDCRL